MERQTAGRTKIIDLEKLMGTVLWLLVLVSIALAAWTGFIFHGALPQPHSVELSVRYSDVEHFAARSGLAMEETLSFLKEQGVTSIGVFEYTLWNLRRDPASFVLSNLELVGELALNTDLAPYRDFILGEAEREGLRLGDYAVFMPAGSWAEQVWEHLGQLGEVEDPARFRLQRASTEGMELFLIRGANYDNLPYLALGANPGQLDKVSGAGLLINPYLAARKIDRSTAAEQALATYDGAPLSTVVFEGGKIPGFPRFTAETADALKKRGLPVALYEYHQYPQGMPELAVHLENSPVVMIPGKNGFPSNREVWNGISERKAQLVELQIRNFAPRLRGEKLLKDFSRQFTLLRQFMEGKGYDTGRLQQFAVPVQPAGVYLFMGMGLVAFTLLFLRIFLPLGPRPLLMLLAGGAVALSVLFRWNPVAAGQILALWTALLFPLYALSLLLLPYCPARGARRGQKPRRGDGPVISGQEDARGGASGEGGRLSFLGRAVLKMGGTFLLSLAGGLLLHGFLSLPPFFSGLEFFRGVKVMYAVPLALSVFIALACYGTRLRPASFDDSPERGGGFCLLQAGELGKPCAALARRLLLRPLVLRDLLLLGVLLLLAYFYLMRTGHVMAVSPVEGWERDVLEQLLGVRPRLKEFLLGYPLALLGLCLREKEGESKSLLAAFLLIAAGVLAPISVLNTFAHVQAPVALSLWRSLHGFWLGGLVGLLLLLAWVAVKHLWARGRSGR